jgi:hypothetical protein
MEKLVVMVEFIKPLKVPDQLEIDIEEFKAYIEDYMQQKSYENWLLYGSGNGQNIQGLTLEKDDSRDW